jgi:hypothetical protein
MQLSEQKNVMVAVHAHTFQALLQIKGFQDHCSSTHQEQTDLWIVKPSLKQTGFFAP